MSKTVKVILWLLVIIIVLAAAIAAYFYFSDSGKRNALTALPSDAVYIIETDNLTEAWATLRESQIWKNLLQSPKFDGINADAMAMDSLINGNKTLEMLFADRQLVISAHMITLTDYDFIFAVNLSKASKVSFLTKYIKDIIGYYDYSFGKRNYKGTEIIELTDKESHEVISLCFIDNILVCSYSPLLIERSIEQKDSEFWIKNPNLRMVSTEVKGNKLFNFYINYSRIADFMKTYVSNPSAFVNSLSNSLFFSAFNVTFENDKLLWEGYTSVNDSIPSYYKAIADQTPARFRAYEMISDKAALYLSMSFGSSETFFNKLKEVFRAEDTTKAQDYEKTIKKVEKVLKVDLQREFFNWIGNEIAFVKLQPSANANEYDALAIIQANDIDMAKSGMEKIARNVKKRTMGLVKVNDTEYKNFNIKYIEYGWFLKLCFGKLFAKFDKPYYIFMDDYVVFSNSPSCLMDFIDDYTVGNTLSHNKEFMEFMDNFDAKSNITAFIQMPKIYSHLFYYSKSDKRKGIQNNKETILSFTRIGVQFTADNGMFKTKFVAGFDESAAFNSELENIESAAEDLYLNVIDSGLYKIQLSNADIARTGPLKIYYDDTTTIKAEGRVINGKPDGLWRNYFEDGRIMCAITYEDGMANGIAMFYFDDDKQTTRVELTFEDDKIVGAYREFYENGNRKALLSFNEGVPDGDAEFYYDSGVIKIEGQYKDGVKQGKWKHYTETGELIDKEKWKKNQDN